MATVINKKDFKKFKSRKNKIELVFDEDKRRDFLCGFRKRKLERKRKAQEKLAQELKEERKRLKKEARESYKKLVVSHRNIPELTNLLSKEYEEDDVTVKVTELSTSEIANRNNWIGENKPVYEVDEKSLENEGESEDPDEENVPGMELKRKIEKVVKQEKAEHEFKTKKEIKKTLRKEATKKVQKSRAFQIKNKMEQQKNKRKSIKKQKEQDRLKGTTTTKKKKNNYHHGKKH